MTPEANANLVRFSLKLHFPRPEYVPAGSFEQAREMEKHYRELYPDIEITIEPNF